MSLERAERDLKRLQSEIARLEAQLNDSRSRQQKIAHFIEMYKLYVTDGETPDSKFDVQSKFGGDPPETVRAVEEILRAAGGPLKTRSLVDELALRGINIGGGNPVTNLSGMLSRWHSLFVPNRREGWGLQEWRQPEAGVAEDPASTSDVDTAAPAETVAKDDDL